MPRSMRMQGDLFYWLCRELDTSPAKLSKALSDLDHVTALDRDRIQLAIVTYERLQARAAQAARDADDEEDDEGDARA